MTTKQSTYTGKRFVIEVRVNGGWQFLDHRTTEQAAINRMVLQSEHPIRSNQYGCPIRVRDLATGQIPGSIESTHTA